MTAQHTRPMTKGTVKALNNGGEHFWKLCPVEVITGSTHTLVEVIHSSNREHRHKLTAGSVSGYYSYLWPLILPDSKKIPNDFDELLEYFPYGDSGSGLMLEGRTFNQKDLSLAVDKVMLFIEEVAAYRSAYESNKEVR